MNIDHLKEVLENEDGLSRTLGMTFISTPEENTLKATMPVDDRTKQVFGFLSGGASLALAENLAGVGSVALCPGKICVGISVSGNHIKAMPYGGTVTAYGTLRHKGRTLHQWQVDLYNDGHDLISTVMVTNYVVRGETPKKENPKKAQKGNE
ncbi:PaaI family thioesterase [Prevotella sp. AGR2160]|uniref:PaaI family thioesterase n=1 Tax=Prevotella sp. AGR2160 TaxID=1280674 RepID=UPI0004071CEF|nr:PaaI family thioesterase [Prevotella sp. AGR2160]